MSKPVPRARLHQMGRRHIAERVRISNSVRAIPGKLAIPMQPPRGGSRLALSVAVAVLISWSIGCQPDEGAGQGEDYDVVDSVRIYALEMEDWWMGVHGTATLFWVIDYENLDLAEPMLSDIWPAPSPPIELLSLHTVVKQTLITALRARFAANGAGELVGLAAAFCDDPTAFPTALSTWWATEVEPLQRWRESGETCDPSERWAGNKGDYTGLLPLRKYRWHCLDLKYGGDDDFGWNYDVSVYDLKLACAMDGSAVLAFEAAEKSWSEAVAWYCSYGFALRWDAALEACE